VPLFLYLRSGVGSNSSAFLWHGLYVISPINVSCPPSLVFFRLFSFLVNVLQSVYADVCDLVCCQVNESDNTVIPIEIGKVDDADEVVEDKVPIKHGVNGDVEGANSGGFEGADLDLADQTLVEDLSRDTDASVIQEISVSGISLLGLPLSFLVHFVQRFASFSSSSASFTSAFCRLIGRSRVLIPIFRFFLCDRTLPSRPSMPRRML